MLNHQRRERASQLARFIDSADCSYARIREGAARGPTSSTSKIVHETTEQLNALFVRWQARCAGCEGHFVADGNIGSDEEWWKAPVRVLFLTKEANDLEGFNHDLRKLFRNANEDGPQKKQFQFNVGRWAYAIHENKNRGIFPSFDVASERSSRQAGLWQSAVVNLKKNAGGGLAAWSEIQAAALRDRSEIVRQIEILDPQIVIFGRDKKSSKLVPRIFADLRPISDLCYSRKSQYWVRQWHPTPIRTSDRALYEVMISTLGQLPPTAFG